MAGQSASSARSFVRPNINRVYAARGRGGQRDENRTYIPCGRSAMSVAGSSLLRCTSDWNIPAKLTSALRWSAFGTCWPSAETASSCLKINTRNAGKDAPSYPLTAMDLYISPSSPAKCARTFCTSASPRIDSELNTPRSGSGFNHDQLRLWQNAKNFTVAIQPYEWLLNVRGIKEAYMNGVFDLIHSYGKVGLSGTRHRTCLFQGGRKGKLLSFIQITLPYPVRVVEDVSDFWKIHRIYGEEKEKAVRGLSGKKFFQRNNSIGKLEKLHNAKGCDS